jgi:antitoxin (DNA-binding transcriptional repressor) of toxin-antitoxin stability system
MSTLTVEEVQANLKDVIAKLAPGEEMAITDGEKTVARLVGAEKPAERRLGTLKGTVLYMAPDFDAPLEDFKDYM